MKRILNKHWIFFIILLMFFLYVIAYFFAPHITVINESDRDINISFYQYVGVIEENEVMPADSKSIDRMAKGNNSSLLKERGSKTFRVNLFDLNGDENLINFDVLHIYWKGVNDDRNNSVEYKISNKNREKTICSLVITIKNNDYIIEENSDGFCLKRITRVFN
ncbi:hypothetical protein ACYJ2D_001920 [Providencia stuartii]